MRNNLFDDIGESIFSLVSQLANEQGAIDLGQGYPNYPPPDKLTSALEELPAKATNHQYAPSSGNSELRSALSELYFDRYGLKYDPETEITITSGATEAICSALLGMVNTGDEVIVFEPIYDQYIPVARRAGADVTVLPLEDSYALPVERLADAVSQSTDFILVNTPHNPTGTVFNRTSLRELVRIAQAHDVVILSDEVYEHLTFNGVKHRPLASFEEARERTLTFGSAGKSFDATGWKIGWALGDSELIESLRLAHQYTTYCSSTPLQQALAEFLNNTGLEKYFQSMQSDYSGRRELLLDGLKRSEFEPKPSSGSYFITAEIDECPAEITTDVDRARWIIDRYGVAAIPMESFYPVGEYEGSRFRFAFCKPKKQIESAVKQLETEAD
jgi:N-succinyldiaminopimelate aminotransferase